MSLWHSRLRQLLRSDVGDLLIEAQTVEGRAKPRMFARFTRRPKPPPSRCVYPSRTPYRRRMSRRNNASGRAFRNIMSIGAGAATG